MITKEPLSVNTSKTLNDTLIIGIGNSGRADDGLGWAFLESLENQGLDPDLLQYRYQLQIEDAALLTEYSRVVFIDAFQGDLENGYRFEQIAPRDEGGFTSHALSPEKVLYLTEELYGHQPQAFVLAIEGLDWELEIGLSETAQHNLVEALVFFNREFEL
jgi:hydrogenase maturation protease